jgi:hypothetical protein
MKTKLITLLTALLLYAVPCMAGGQTSPSTPDEIPVYTGDDRPRSGSPVWASNVRCSYFDGVLAIEFDEPEGVASVSVSSAETGETVATSFDTSSPSYINIGTAPGNYVIVIKTNKTYYGYLTLE